LQTGKKVQKKQKEKERWEIIYARKHRINERRKNVERNKKLENENGECKWVDHVTGRILNVISNHHLPHSNQTPYSP
jgi:hypothetical protein